MFKLKLTIALLFVFTVGYAQMNLIANGDFEDTVACPTGQSQIANATGWYISGGSPDYFNTCNSGIVGVPNNTPGFQTTHSGNGYSGVICFHASVPNAREYFSSQLLIPLDSGKKYCCTLYASPAGGFKFTADAIGVFFSRTYVTAPFNTFVIDTTPALASATIITDTSGWTKVSSVFVALGEENYVNVGNFNTDSETNTQLINSSGWGGVYFYIDDISLYEVTEPVAGNDTTICIGDSLQIGTAAVSWTHYTWQPSAGLSDSTISNPIAKPTVTTTYTLTISDTAIRECTCDSVATITITVDDCTVPETFFIPTLLYADQLFSISGLLPESRLTIYNALGQRVYFSENYGNNLNSSTLAAGCYIFDLQQPGKELWSRKFCVVK